MPLADCIDYNCEEGSLGTYHENECAKEFVGGGSSIVIFSCNSELTDPSDGTQVLAEIAADRAWLLTGLSMSIEAPAAQEQESNVACRPSSVTTYDWTGNYTNRNVNAVNDLLHDIIFSGKRFGGILIYECQSNKDGFPQSKWINEVITAQGGLVFPATTTEFQSYNGTFKWESLKSPKTVVTPTGVFD